MSSIRSFTQNKTFNVEGIHEKEGLERKDKRRYDKWGTVKDRTLECMKQKCDVDDSICSHKVVKEEKNKQEKTYPENVGVKESLISRDLQEKFTQHVEEMKKDLTVCHVERRNEDKSKVETFAHKIWNKTNMITSKADDRSDTIFVLEMEGPRFGPQIFKGDGEISISEFLKDYEHYMAMQAIEFNDRQMGLCIRNFLTDRARDVYDQIESKENYNEVKKTLLNKFQTQILREKAELKLKHVYQGQGESVLDFANRLTKAVKQAVEGRHEVDQQERLKDEFCNRISVEYRYLVNGHRPETFEEAYEKAELYEHEFEVKREQQGKDTTQVLEAHVAGQSSSKWRSAGQQSNGMPHRRRRICYRCRQPGHLIKDCNFYQEGDHQRNTYGSATVTQHGYCSSVNTFDPTRRRRRVCYKCRQPGHEIKECWLSQEG